MSSSKHDSKHQKKIVIVVNPPDVQANKNSLKCYICDSIFLSKGSLKTHITFKFIEIVRLRDFFLKKVPT